MNKQISFYLPDFYYKYDINLKLIRLLKEHKEWFNNFKIGAIYGSFPGAIWNGGRFVPGLTSMENIKATIDIFNSYDVPIRFTFTNCLLEQEHVYDTYCNMIMKIANNGMNEVLVNSPVLELYLREKYPNFKYILSTTRCERDVNKINEACSLYHLVVPDFRDNHNKDFLNSLINKDKIELLADEYCLPGCSLRSEHYLYHSKCQLNYLSSNNFNCPYHFDLLSDRWKNPTIIQPEELYTYYANMGFSNFKIVGRGMSSLDVIESYVKYLVKPEYKDEVRYQLLKEILK